VKSLVPRFEEKTLALCSEGHRDVSGEFPADDEIQALLQRRAEAPAAEPELTDVAEHTNDLLDAVEAGFDVALAHGDSGRGHVMADVSDARPFELQELKQVEESRRSARHSTESPDDVGRDVHIEMGRAELQLDEANSLRPGAVVSLDKLAGDPVDILVNGRLLARGEVLVLNDRFCVRVAEILARDF